MAYNHNADQERQLAKDKIDEAIQCLHNLTDPSTSGFAEYKTDFREDMIKLELELKGISRRIKNG